MNPTLALLLCAVITLAYTTNVVASADRWEGQAATLVGKRGIISGRLLGEVLPETSVLVYTDNRVLRGVSVRKDGSFEVLQLPIPATYTLTVANARDYYNTARVSLDTTGEIDTVLIVESTLGKVVKQNSSKMKNAGGSVMVSFEPIAPVSYDVQKPSMDGILAFLQKPIVILLILVALMVLMLPYFADTLDPDTYAELFGDKRPRPGKPADVYQLLMGLAKPNSKPGSGAMERKKIGELDSSSSHSNPSPGPQHSTQAVRKRKTGKKT